MDMKWLVVALLSATTSVRAGGIDRSGQGLGVLFEDGARVEMSWAHVAPSVRGVDLLGGKTGDVAGDYALTSLSAKLDVNDRLSLAMVADQTYGADILYGPASPLLGGTEVDVAAHALLGLARFRVDPAFSVHAGLRVQRSAATVSLRGLAYGPVDGYRVRLGPDNEFGWVAGAAWEQPDIAMRLALTYHDAIDHRLATTETGPRIDPDGPGPAPDLPLLDGRSTTRISTPRALNFDFQTGIAPDTLLFGQARWAKWSEFRVVPARFLAVTGEGLIELSDTRTYTLGVGYRLNERWSGALALTREAKGDPLVSPLAPVNGRRGVSLAAMHTRGAVKISAGVSYIELGDALLETGTPDTQRATMRGNDTLAFGIKVSGAF
jgi:long-subunit fatty acid transport protein